MVDAIPAWLVVARKYLGVEEIPGSQSNPTILRFIANISGAFPEQAQYAANYKNDDIAWCGVFAADCLAEVGIRGPFNKSNDLLSWMWANAWQTWGQELSEPRVGAILCFNRHVGFLNRIIDDDTFEVIGGNQSSPQGGAVTLSTRSDAVSMRWPNETGVITQPVVDERPELKLGDSGPFVSELQRLLGITVSGVFDAVTDAAVRAFQASRGLTVDGEVGNGETWPALLGKPSGVGGTGLKQAVIDQIVALAGASALARYSWEDRGVAPRGYIKGMAVTFAHVYAKWKVGDSAARVMAAAVNGSDNFDALFWYDGVLRPAGVDTLRRLFSLLIGLGMRESSGNYSEGRDTTASNTSADTAEAGLFQQSWNSRAASAELPKLLAAYSSNASDGFLSIFREGVNAKSTGDAGSGDGATFQSLCKSKPAFAVECAAVGLRVLRQHWGPINRREAEIRPEADALLQQVQAAVDALNGEPLPPLSKIDDDILLVIRIILSEEKTMDDDLRAALLRVVNTKTIDPDLRAALLKSLGVAPAPLPAPEPIQGPTQGFDFLKLLPLLQNPVIHKLLGGKPVTMPELLPLALQAAALFGVKLPTLLASPVDQQPPPVAPPTTPVIQKPAVQVTGVASVLAILAQLAGLAPASVGPGATTAGILTTAIPILATLVAPTGVFGAVLKGAMALFGFLKSKAT